MSATQSLFPPRFPFFGPGKQKNPYQAHGKIAKRRRTSRDPGVS